MNKKDDVWTVVKQEMKLYQEHETEAGCPPEWKKKDLKKKRLKRIEQALDCLTYRAYRVSAEQLTDCLTILEHYHLVMEYSMTFNKDVSVRIVLTEFGRKISSLIYGRNDLPPFSQFDGGGISFEQYETGYSVAEEHWLKTK